MAGSYKHAVDDAGRLRTPESLVGMIENGGDMVEAVEELYGMIWRLAGLAASGDAPAQVGYDPTIPVHDRRAAIVEFARQNWEAGIDSFSPGRQSDEDYQAELRAGGFA